MCGLSVSFSFAIMTRLVQHAEMVDKRRWEADAGIGHGRSILRSLERESASRRIRARYFKAFQQ
jgi:hypothetical protein